MDEQQPEASGSGASLRDRVQGVIDALINPVLAMHGGYVALTDVEGSTVYVTMGGGCQGCAGSQMTLRAGIEAMIRDRVPEVTEVRDGTDHGAGVNPFY